MDYTLLEPKTDADFAKTGAKLLRDAISSVLAERGQCILGLSGGKTPHDIYKLLGQDETLDWSNVWIFLTDERYVPADSQDSNRHLLMQTLFRYVKMAQTERFIFPDTSLPIDECVAKFEQDLGSLFERGACDIVSLGIGDDGHICSLFPPLPKRALDGSCLALHTTTERFAGKDRISITLPPLHKASQQFFFMKGETKKKTWEEMEASNEGPERWPMKGVMALGETTVVIAK